jgi:hypothetical protein
MEIHPHPDGLELLRVVAPEYGATFEVYGKCPVQAFGSVLGRDLYFRARHDAWTFDVADRAGNLPSDGFFESDGFYREGQCPKAGWMPLEDAVKIIVRCLAEYTGVRPERRHCT